MGKLLGDSTAERCGSAFNSLGSSPGIGAVDNAALEEALLRGGQKLGVAMDSAMARQLVEFERHLLRWNERINLVGRQSTPFDVMERHLLDSVAAAEDVAAAQSLVDIGAGAGFPGIPLKIAQPVLDVTLVEATGKKVAFMRSALDELKLGQGIRARQTRAQGAPTAEGVVRADAAISRALVALPEWLSLAAHYVVPGGRVIAMMARAEDAHLERAAANAGAALVRVRRYELPFSRAARAIAVFEPVS